MAVLNCTVDKKDWYKMYIEYSISTNADKKQSTITHALKIEQLTDTYDFSGNMNVTYTIEDVVTGKTTDFTYNSNLDMNDKGNKGYTITIKSGTTTINHNTTTGNASFKISCSGTCYSGGYGPGDIKLSEKTIKCERIPLYTLSKSAGTGSSITVNRTSSSGNGKTGNLSNGAALYYGDVLKITFSASTNYKIVTHKVNNKTFTSGNSHTVSGNVTVSSTAQVLASKVGATNANIGSKSTITVTKYNDNYYHTLQYSFGNLSGYITSDGGISTTASKFKNTSVSFSIPTSFYGQIPNDPSGTCTITCRTYSSASSTTQLGNATTDNFTVTADKTSCRPTVTGTVVDTNPTTKKLTNNPNTLIKNKSTALCTLTATPKNSATISSVKIAGSAVTGKTGSNNVVTATKTYANVTNTSFVFYAKDSRDYDNSTTVSPTVIQYITLTCNPSVYRDTPTGNSISMDISGNFYRGSFGAYTNTLTIKYRHKKTSGSYPSTAQTLEDGSETDANGWITVSDSLITKGTSSYRSTNKLTLLSYPETGENGETIYPGFDYRTDYEFQVKVYDGAEVVLVDETTGEETKEDVILSTVNKTIDVTKGIPVFDWGEDNFNINGGLTVGGSVIVGGMSLATNKVLWGHNRTSGLYMNEAQTASLTEGVSKQAHGVVLVFCYYDGVDNTNKNFESIFVPKELVALTIGKTHIYQLGAVTFNCAGAKILTFKNDTTIIGSEQNQNSGTGSTGITFHNDAYVLRYVIGV